MSASPQKIIPLIDLTRLNEQDDSTAIKDLCLEATTPYGNVAAVCIYPRFISVAKSALAKTAIKIATVVNFPQGQLDLVSSIHEIKQAMQLGADEIDIVFPYSAFMQGQELQVFKFLQAMRDTSKNHILKVILETGALESLDLIKQAATIVIHTGADFIKTSTGKGYPGATLNATQAILETILQEGAEKKAGLKISGGIKTLEQANTFIAQVKNIMGENWISSKTLRLGASNLLRELL